MRRVWASVFRDADWLSPERIRRIAVAAAATLLAIFCVGYWQHIQVAPGDQPAVALPQGEDFVNFYAGARLTAAGRAQTVYDLGAFLAFEQQQAGAFHQFRWYAYPPVALLVFLPLAALAYIPSYLAWLIVGTAAGAWALRPWMRWPAGLLAMLATPAALFNAVSGQNGQITAALMGGAIALLDSRPALAGVLCGALCFKPQLGVLIPVALAAGGRWRTFLAAAATVAALTGASVALFGWDTWAAYLHNAGMNRYILEQGRFPDLGLIAMPTMNFWVREPTVFAAVRLAGGGVALAYGAQATSAALALAVTVAIWRRAATPTAVKGAVLVLATLAATPYAWDYDLVVVTFAAVWLWQDGARRGFRPGEKAALAACVAGTLLFGSIAKAGGPQIGPAVLWAMLILAARRGWLASAGWQAGPPTLAAEAA